VTKIVLVTGAGGFVGSHVVRSILDRTDWYVIGVDSFRHNGHFINLVDVVDENNRNRVTSLVHDLTAPFSRGERATLVEVDYIVNVASYSSVDASIAHPAEFVRNNVELALTVLELCRHVRPQRLIHISTDEVYGSHVHSSIVDHRPSSPYAASKAAQADLVWAYARRTVGDRRKCEHVR
jgi:dTDP-glucose 4,6-dehydratase